VLAILIPVLGRKNQIKNVLNSIKLATVVEHRVIFICSPRDSARSACLAATSAETITVPWVPGRADFAKKINLAYEEVEADWYFQAATDLVFQPRWDTLALEVGKSVGVVGTNDLGNPHVKRGHAATHILFSREYIETFGGTYDGSAKVFSEEYDHSFVDTEFVQTALLHGQFRPSIMSIVEHMHPHWGKGEMDSTYEKSVREFKEDAVIYNNRMRAARRQIGVHRRPQRGYAGRQ
jgi:hypothetical protein